MKIDEFNRETLRTLLKVGILTVTFIKNDGNRRTMVCTLVPDYLDKLPSNTIMGAGGVKYHVVNNAPLRVFDLELHEWRQFVAANVTDASWEPANESAITLQYPEEKVYNLMITIRTKCGNLDVRDMVQSVLAGRFGIGCRDVLVKLL